MVFLPTLSSGDGVPDESGCPKEGRGCSSVRKGTQASAAVCSDLM
jgi:hypothetical protein